MNVDTREPIVITFHVEPDGVFYSSNMGHRREVSWEDVHSITKVLHAREATCKRLGYATFHSPDGFETAHEAYDVSVTYRIDNIELLRDSLIDLLARREKGPQDRKVNHPSHYGGGDNPYETIKVIRAWKLDFSLGNAVKYISRAGKKDGESTVDDLKKALWYIQNKIDELEQG
jgi:hypothetical protein